MPHVPVLLKEAIEGLKVSAGSTIVDATAGAGGHTRVLCDLAGEDGTIVAIDQDGEAIERVKEATKECKSNVLITLENFRNIDKILEKNDIKEINGILFDLGLSSHQLEDSGRGFSFQKDEPLAMTFKNDTKGIVTAGEIVNEWGEETIADILYGFGEEQFARRIAKKIVEEREENPINNTRELVEIIEKSVPVSYRKKKIHPATKTFQALRMAVNDEWNALKEGVEKSFEALASGGRMAVISFHSIEDRFIKNFFKDQKEKGIGKIITKRPITATEEELKENKRARSAKLRIIEKI